MWDRPGLLTDDCLAPFLLSYITFGPVVPTRRWGGRERRTCGPLSVMTWYSAGHLPGSTVPWSSSSETGCRSLRGTGRLLGLTHFSPGRTTSTLPVDVSVSSRLRPGDWVSLSLCHSHPTEFRSSHPIVQDGGVPYLCLK